MGGGEVRLVQPKGNAAPQDAFCLLSCAALRFELGSPRRSRRVQGTVDLVSVRLNDPDELDSDSFA